MQPSIYIASLDKKSIMMKTTLITILVFIIFVATTISCRKQDCNKPQPNTLTNAIITGVDFRRCACCGGLMITFTNDSIPYSAAFYDIKDLPSSAGISEQSTFPIKVKVAYSKVSQSCGNFVNITTLERR